MKFRPITLRQADDTIIEINPLNILKISGDSESICLRLRNQESLILYKTDYYYPHWDYFMIQLIRVFKFERP